MWWVWQVKGLMQGLATLMVATAILLAAYAYYESVGDHISWRKAVVEAEMNRCKVKR